MSGKEKFDYWWKIIFLAIMCLIGLAAGVYTLVKFPFSLLILLYVVMAVVLGGLSGLGARALFKEYRKKIQQEQV